MIIATYHVVRANQDRVVPIDGLHPMCMTYESVFSERFTLPFTTTDADERAFVRRENALRECHRQYRWWADGTIVSVAESASAYCAVPTYTLLP